LPENRHKKTAHKDGLIKWWVNPFRFHSLNANEKNPKKQAQKKTLMRRGVLCAHARYLKCNAKTLNMTKDT